MFGLNTITGKKFFAGNDKLYVTSIFYTFQGEGIYTGRPAVFIRLARCNLACEFCFTAGTLVTMADGSRKPIEKVAVGDRVMSWDGSGFVGKRVEATMESTTPEITAFTTQHKRAITACTPNHPFLTTEGWLPAKDITPDHIFVAQRTPRAQRLVKPADQLRILDTNHYINPGRTKDEADHRWTRITRKSGQDASVYNLTIADTNTFIANDIVTHNCDAMFESGDWMSIDEVLERARDETRRLYSGEMNKVGFVVTGGEPLLQTDNVVKLFNAARSEYAWCQIESNGTQDISPLQDFVTTIVSPKCVMRGGKGERYLTPHPSIFSADALKFVVTTDPTDAHHLIPEWVRDFTGQIYVSPMNVYARMPAKIVEFKSSKAEATLATRSTVDEVISFWEEGLLDRAANQANHEYAARLAVENAYIFNLQSHLYGSMA